MAPSRRRGLSKAAAAAAARRQWKVGDLVLAKVKGFPAWPATVSEPEKWGYSADWKKVLVYFFGTQQIAFCNPADVEAFTEEKKESLLIKRHGKGADFVRAVHEIIDSYEKGKKQDQDIHGHCIDEVTVENACKSMESFDESGLKDETMAVAVKSCPKNSDSVRAKNDSGFQVEGVACAIEKDAFYDEEMPAEEPTGNLMDTETPLQSTYSRKKLGGMQAQNFVTQKRAPSARRARSSSRLDSSRFQTFILPSSNGGRSARNVASSVLRVGSVRRNKRIRKSPNVSERYDMDSPAFVSNGSLEENGSEIATVDSDSFNEGSTVESDYNLPQPESVVEDCEGDVELSHRLDFQAKAVVVKKKRKPSRKRASNGATELSDRQGKEAVLEIELHKTVQISPSDNEKSNGRYSKEDGDEHLPLVKRARVRMGRPSSAGEELDALMQMEEKSLEVSNSCLGRVCTTVNCEEDSPVDRNSFVVKGDVGNSSPSNKCTLNKPSLWDVKKYQQFGCSVDGEAALPPSKRLHRALEAMSANAAEDGQTSSEAPSTMKTLFNGSCLSFSRECPNTSVENKAMSEFRAHNVDSFSNNASQDRADGFFTNFTEPIGEESTHQVAACNQTVKSNDNPEHVFCKDILVEVVDCADGRNPSGPSLGTNTAELVAQSPKPLSPNLDRKQARLQCDQALVELMLPSNDDCKIENYELSKSCEKNTPSELSRMSSDPVSGKMEIAVGSPQNDTKLLLCSDEGNCETTKLLNLPSDENNQDNGICEVVKETKLTLKDSNATPSPTTEEVTMAAIQGRHILLSSSLSDDHLSHEAVSGMRSSSSPTGGLGSTAASPPNTSICNMPASDNSNFLENNGCFSPTVHLHHEKPKHAGKSSNRVEANAALTSFGVALGTLTRTKESIGRATRIAIDCAKFGFAPKVVEILVRCLESESSLHRRVDLFFLVDSITQCSRGLKGEVGGIYPSAIQAVLSRLLLAAAPPGSSAQENRRQCLKVLRLWQERRILPESIIRRHIRDLDSLSTISSSGAFSRRPLRTERAFDDPLREMEGMVDEYGSNSSFQLPGFCMPPMLKDEDEGSDSDGESFEAVTPEHNLEKPEEQHIPTIEKRRHILEDVDGELEMEDVAPTCEAETSSTGNVAGVNTAGTSNHQFEQHFPLPFAPPLPKDVPPSSPPLPTSPPPPPPPLSFPRPSANTNLVTNGLLGSHNVKDDSKQSIAQQSVAPRINPMISDVVHHHAPENRDPQMPMQIPESANTCSFSSLHLSHPPIQTVNNDHQVDGATVNNKAFHLRPPHPAPSNQFSYVQADQRVQSQRDVPQSYPTRFPFVQNTDSGNFYSDHDRMKIAPHDVGESWRLSAPSLSGPCYPDNGSVSYAPIPYAGPPCESAMPNQGWAFPPRAMNHGLHREPFPYRPPSEGPIPVAIRAPNFWRPR